jgi:hypothetical protein
MALNKIFTPFGNKVAESKDSALKKEGFTNNNNLPWGNFKDSFFKPIKLEPSRHDGLYPYRLLVIDVKDNQVVKGDNPKLESTDIVKNKSNSGGVSFSIGGGSTWVFNLPLTPKQLQITDQFAINTSATMRGVIEEHNGVKFKMISASGTTGIWPGRINFEDGVLITPEKEDKGVGTGYFQALLLQQFLEQYAMAKKDPAKKRWRLVFDCPKTNESFIVTPIQYSVTKSERSPNEFLYNMQFKAWKRVDLNSAKKDIALGSIKPDVSAFDKFNQALSKGRSFMSSSLNTIKAIRADFRKPFDALRKVSMFVKDASGAVLQLSDLPSKILQDIDSSIKKVASDLGAADSNFSAAFANPFGLDRGKGAESKARSVVSKITSENAKFEGVSAEQIEAGVLGVEARDAQRSSPINDIFNEPEGNFDFFNGIDVNSLELTPQQQIAIEDEIELNALISVEELKEITQELQDLMLDLTNSFGAGDAFFSEVYGRPEPKERATTMTLEEFELISALEEIVLNLNILTSTRELDDDRRQSSLEYVGGLADDSDITFDSASTAKQLVPVPFNLTIEEISARYLGDADRYNEIITLNNLRSPYIDEDGFFYSLLSNGDGRQFNIEANENLFVGQKIQLSSNTVPTFTRKITNVEKITDTNYLITVDGLSNLDLLKTNDQAKIKAFLPGTVNSQNQIYIPSDIIVDEEPRTFEIASLNDDPLTNFSKVDWLLDDNGDIVLNSFGEVGLANGITNLIQSLKMKVLTQKGQLLSNSSFGLGLAPGAIVNDINTESVLKDLREMVLQDPRFEAVEKIEINVFPPELSITIVAVLANGKGIFPINFTT